MRHRGDGYEHKGTQFVFSDLGTYKPNEWNVYSEIKRKLVDDYGIPESEIQFIQQHKTEAARKKVIAAMNDGSVRVLFGSTDMLGTGVNAQKRAVAIHHLDCPWRPSDLAQRDGRAIRKGNEVAKLYADNKVDIVIYAVEKSLDSYKFNLLHNKQMFITQLKSGAMGARTIDEGSSDEKSGMNFSEYMAILSGNTDLLDKAKLEKKVAALESERKAFNKEKHNSIYKLEAITHDITRNANTTSKIESDLTHFKSVVQHDKDGNRLNPLKIYGLESDNIKDIGAKLAEIGEKARTDGNHKEIGELYGFKIVVKTESSTKDLFELTQNRFYIQGVSLGDDNLPIKYSYNNGNLATDPKLAVMNFINALDKMPSLIEQGIVRGKKLSSDITILRDTASGVWKKEDELKELKSEVSALERKITLSLKPVDQTDGKSTSTDDNTISQKNAITTPESISEKTETPEGSNIIRPQNTQSSPRMRL